MAKGSEAIVITLFLWLTAAHLATAQDYLTEGPINSNAWCVNAILNMGVLHGFAEPYHERMAAHATAVSRARQVVLAQTEGMDAKAFQDFDKLHFDNQRRQVERFIVGDPHPDFQDRWDRCRARGIDGMNLERRHLAFIDAYDDELWCAETLATFLSMNMFQSEERAARARRAVTWLRTTVDEAFLRQGMAQADRDAIVAATDFRALMQVQAFSITGDKSRFERDYEPCFAYGDLAAPTPDFTPYPTREVRPTRTTVAWDYPLSFDFRFNLWCGAGMLLQGPVRDGMNERTIAEVSGHIGRKIAAEVDLLGIFPEHLTTMQGEAVAQIAYEFERAAETGRIDEMSYDPAQCFFIGAADMLNELLPET